MHWYHYKGQVTLITLLLLIFSKSYIEFSTSGLENPLSHLLIAVFIIYFLKSESKFQNKIFIALLASLLMLNRLDLLLIVLPPLVYDLFNSKKLSNLKYYLIGFLPLILWEIFSLVYYGFPFPNTAYAKLNTGIERYDLILQGLHYFRKNFYMDPLTLVIIFSATLSTVFVKANKYVSIVIGIWLYLIYRIAIGGDYFSGRFFSITFIISVFLLSRYIIKYNSILILTFIIVLGLLAINPPVLLKSYTGIKESPHIRNAFIVGPEIDIGFDQDITDERFMNNEYFGFLRIISKKATEHPWKKNALVDRKESKNTFYSRNVGIYGYFLGLKKHIIDLYALADPLLSKIPTDTFWWIGREKPADWRMCRIGHFARKVPDGYTETHTYKSNRIKNEYLKEYYDHLSILISGEIFSLQRLIEIWNFNTGKYNHLLKKYNKTKK